VSLPTRASIVTRFIAINAEQVRIRAIPPIKQEGV
jgi:hypothetical protein